MVRPYEVDTDAARARAEEESGELKETPRRVWIKALVAATQEEVRVAVRVWGMPGKLVPRHGYFQ